MHVTYTIDFQYWQNVGTQPISKILQKAIHSWGKFSLSCSRKKEKINDA